MKPRINPDRFLNVLTELCSIPSPSRQEERVAARILEIAHDYGATIRETGRAADGQGNIVLANENDHPEPLFLSAHMDTVPVPPGTDQITVIREGGRIRTDGSSVLGGDDKVGVAAALEMLALCAENPDEHRSLEVIIMVQEELGCLGSRQLDPSVIRAGNGFNLDGETAPFTAINRAPRKSMYTCTVHGRSAHGALNPDDGINAILVASALIPRLPMGLLGKDSTANIGVIRGGEQTNVVPDRVALRGELRSFDGDQFELYQNQIIGACADVGAEFGVPVEIDWDPAYDEYTVLPDEICATWFAAACKNLDREPEFLSSRGGGDSNNLNRIGLRNLVFGLGMHGIHTPDEFLVEEEILSAVELLCAIVFPSG